MKSPTVLDLFSGCGGVSYALSNSGFKVIGAIDNDPSACETYSKNNPEVSLFCEDIRRINPRDVRKSTLGNGVLDVLVVCSPCQPFSNQNKKRLEDRRSSLVLESLRFVEAFSPRIVFFENVPGLRAKSRIIKTLTSELSRQCYKVGDPTILDMADYGVPQRRKRCLLLAFNGSIGADPVFPPPTTPQGRRKTVRMSIEGLSRLGSGQKDETDKLHFSRNHRQVAKERMAFVEVDGGSRFSIPKNLQLDCHKDKKCFPDVYGRMWWDRVAPTLTTGCTDITRGRFMHPEQNRAITLREAARLQTFPDEFEFSGSSKQIATQIGNAVPPTFVQEIAPWIKSTLCELPNNTNL